MDIWGLLTYLGLLIAIYTFSPSYYKLNIKLSNPLWKLLFLLSLLIIYFLSFDVVLILINDNTFLENKVWLILLFLLTFHFLFLYFILVKSRLTNYNKEIFLEGISSLINLWKYDELYKIIDWNIYEIFNLYYKCFSFKDRILKHFKWYYRFDFVISDEQLNLISEVINSDIVIKNNDNEADKCSNIINRKIDEIKFFFKSITLNNLNYSINNLLFNRLGLSFSKRPIIENIFHISIFELSKKYSLNNVDLAFKILKLLVKYNNKDDLKTFLEWFLVNVFSNMESLVTSQIIKHNSKNEWNKWAYYLFLLENIDIEFISYIIDLSIHNLIFKDNVNIRLLNEKYIPGVDKYNRIDNWNLVNHIWSLLNIYLKIDYKKYLDKDWNSRLWNFFYYNVRDLIDITNFDSENWNDWFLNDSASMYLVKEIIELLWNLNEQSNFQEMSSYNSIINLILSNQNVPDYYKKEIVINYYYFVKNWNEEHYWDKFNYFKELLTRFRSLKFYFKIDVIDKIKFWYNNEMKDFFDYVDWL